jgi:hypothetical protein
MWRQRGRLPGSVDAVRSGFRKLDLSAEAKNGVLPLSIRGPGLSATRSTYTKRLEL